MNKRLEIKIKRESPEPLYLQIEKNLLSLINSKKLKQNEKIPSEDEISETCKVSRMTARQAVMNLERKGLIYRVPGKGTFATEPKKIKGENITRLFLPTRGHLFGEFSRLLIQNLQSIGYYSLVFDTSLLASRPEEKQKIEDFFNTTFETLIIDGNVAFPFKLLVKKKMDISRIIFIFRFETSLAFPEAIKVLSDFEEGGYLAVKHLLDLGHKKILLFTYPLHPQPYLLIHPFLAGCQRAFRKKGLDYKSSFLIEINEPENNEEKLTKALSRPDRPTAIFAFGDCRAKDIFSVAKKLHLLIPEDLAIVGYYNTPWCEGFDVPLTSVSIEEEKIVQVVRGILTDTKDYSWGESIWIKPKLIIRSSCGAKKRG